MRDPVLRCLTTPFPIPQPWFLGPPLWLRNDLWARRRPLSSVLTHPDGVLGNAVDGKARHAGAEARCQPRQPQQTPQDELEEARLSGALGRVHLTDLSRLDLQLGLHTHPLSRVVDDHFRGGAAGVRELPESWELTPSTPFDHAELENF